MTVEEAFAELERLIGKMETEGITLEESFACYEKGIRLVRFCNERIDRVEKKVRILRGEGQPEAGFPEEELP
ncbi:MAG: exodeoxyribonuclease VII small subunit [Eubacteriales bacterium]|nr:exodeoxyribonuclease VII small subunit [Eubacteriales bacterium]